MNEVPTVVLPTVLEALAISVGGISGALHARRREMDVLGILVVAFVSALGGGVIRDILLVSGPPVFLTSPAFLAYALFGALVGWIFATVASRATMLMQVIDGLFIGVWVLVGASKALGGGLGFLAAALVAVITAAGGGILRDLFCGERVTLLLPGQWLAAAALVGALTFLSAFWLGVDVYVAQWMCIVVASTIRFLSSAFDVRTPMPMDVSKILARSRS